MLDPVSPAFLLILSAAVPPPPTAFFDDPVSVYAEGDEEEVDDDSAPDAAEAESESAQPGSTDGRLRYSADLNEAELQRRWKDDLSSLGTISVGFADQGRLINAARMPQDEAFVCQRPELAFGTQETVEALTLAFRAVHKQFPASAPARLSHIGLADGGYLRPHRSHQSGRDADIGFFYTNDSIPGRGARREKLIDPARNWALLRALVTQTDVQVILVDRGIRRCCGPGRWARARRPTSSTASSAEGATRSSSTRGTTRTTFTSASTRPGRRSWDGASSRSSPSAPNRTSCCTRCGTARPWVTSPAPTTPRWF